MLRHLKRELMQAILLLLLNPELMHAYLHGFEIHSSNDITRLFFPWFFCHSMDFIEKWDPFFFTVLIMHRILVSCIKYMSTFPCPCCLVPKKHFSRLGTVVDMRQRVSKAHIDGTRKQGWIKITRKSIFENGASVAGTTTKILEPESLTPTMVCFFFLLAIF